MCKTAYAQGREMIWERSAHHYMDSFQRARLGRQDQKFKPLTVRTLAEQQDERPDWRLDHLCSYMGGGAERAVRVRYVADWMSVNYLDRPGRNNQEHAKQSEEKPPRALHIRSWPRAQHDESNISQYVTTM